MEERNIHINNNVDVGNKIYKIVEIYNDNSIKISDDNKDFVLKPDEFGDYYLNTDLLRFYPLFTYIPYVDIKILSYLDDKSLKFLCVLNTYVSELCKDEILWREKLEIKFGENVLNYVKDNFELKYKFLSKYGVSVNIAAENGYLEILKWMHNKNGKLPDQQGVNLTAQNGYSEILKWVYSINKSLPDHWGANLAAGNGNLEILGWVYDINKIIPDKNGLTFAARNNHLEILKWVHSINKNLPTQWGLNNAARNNHLEILKWVFNKNGSLPSQNSVNKATENGYLEILKWLRNPKK